MKPRTSNEAIFRALELQRKGCKIREIVSTLNREGIKPPIAKRWNKNMVKILLRRNGVPPTREEVGPALAATKTISVIAPKSSCDETKLAAKALLNLPISAERKVELLSNLYGATN